MILLSSLCLCLLTSHYKLTLLIDKNKIFQLFCLNIECREIFSIFQRNFFHHFKILLRFFPEVKHTGVCQTCALIQYFFFPKYVFWLFIEIQIQQTFIESVDIEEMVDISIRSK